MIINKLSAHIVGRLLDGKVITDDEYELYVFGVFVLLSQIMYAVIMCVIGAVFNCIGRCAVFYCAFQLLRSYAGGYHANTQAACTILSTLSMIVCAFMIKLSAAIDLQIPLIAAAAVSAILIFVLCPVDTPEKPLSKAQRRYVGKISRIILSLIVAVIAAGYIFSVGFLFLPLCISIILECVLIIAGRKKYRKNK